VRYQIQQQAQNNEIARRNMRQAQIRQKRNHDAKVRGLIQYLPGDYVMCFVNVVSQNHMRKLEPLWRIPYAIDEVLENGILYRLGNGEMVHYNRLKRYYPRPHELGLEAGTDELIVWGTGDDWLRVEPQDDAESFPEYEAGQDEYLPPTNKPMTPAAPREKGRRVIIPPRRNEDYIGYNDPKMLDLLDSCSSESLSTRVAEKGAQSQRSDRPMRVPDGPGRADEHEPSRKANPTQDHGADAITIPSSSNDESKEMGGT
jgi:hypothetical protein